MNQNKYRKIYEGLTDKEKKIIDEIYNVVNNHCKENEIKIAYDDRAEEFIDAITKYIVESKQ
jgi:hypothetical protein